ncbi:MAG: hypothetical protein ISR96_02920 [Nitrospira sp.]|nr:hypothetical protein [bacterium]MBL7048466.1 hypothetical protein [Nitrospira sp.]
MNSLSIDKGRILVYRLFDVAHEIDLATMESRARKGVKRLRLSKHTYMEALEFNDPPVSLELDGFAMPLFGKELTVCVIAKAYDFGVISIAFDITIPHGTSFEALETAAISLDMDELNHIIAREYCHNLVKDLGDAVIDPYIKDEFEEEYMIFYIEKLDREMDALEFFKKYDPSKLLLYETRQVSHYARAETLKHRFSYYPDDFVVVHLDNALVMEPSGSLDIPDLLEFATAQILELRYYDNVLDKEMAWIYSEIPKNKSASIFKLRNYEKLAKKIIYTITDLTAVTEKVDNALKVTEDVYYAKIYKTAMILFQGKAWEDSIRGKLATVTDAYKMICDEISTNKGHILELWIIILIVIEIILLIVIEW